MAATEEVHMPDGTPGLRRDAARNRAALIEAAAKEFAVWGAGARVVPIARRAGVGVGTFFRHFPTKQLLLDQVVLRHLAAMTSAANSPAPDGDPGHGLTEFLHVAGDPLGRSVLRYLHSGADLSQQIGHARDDLVHLLDDLLARARAAGAVKDYVRTTDIVLLLSAGGTATELPAVQLSDLHDRYATIIREGLRDDRPAERMPSAHDVGSSA